MTVFSEFLSTTPVAKTLFVLLLSGLQLPAPVTWQGFLPWAFCHLYCRISFSSEGLGERFWSQQKSMPLVDPGERCSPFLCILKIMVLRYCWKSFSGEGPGNKDIHYITDSFLMIFVIAAPGLTLSSFPPYCMSYVLFYWCDKTPQPKCLGTGRTPFTSHLSGLALSLRKSEQELKVEIWRQELK